MPLHRDPPPRNLGSPGTLNEVRLQVTAQDGTACDYRILATRGESSDARLEPPVVRPVDDNGVVLDDAAAAVEVTPFSGQGCGGEAEGEGLCWGAVLPNGLEHAQIALKTTHSTFCGLASWACRVASLISLTVPDAAAWESEAEGSGELVALVALPVGTSSLKVLVEAGDRVESGRRTHTLLLSRTGSSVAALGSLAVRGGKLQTTLPAGALAGKFVVQMYSGSTTLRVIAKPRNRRARLRIGRLASPASVRIGSSRSSIPLEIVAEDRQTTWSATIEVCALPQRRAPLRDALPISPAPAVNAVNARIPTWQVLCQHCNATDGAEPDLPGQPGGFGSSLWLMLVLASGTLVLCTVSFVVGVRLQARRLRRAQLASYGTGGGPLPALPSNERQLAAIAPFLTQV